MPSHFSSIGFPVSDMDAFKTLLTRAAREGQSIPVPGGHYVRFHNDGAELWVQVKKNNILDCNPHFAGRSQLMVRITELIPEEEEFNGAVYCWVISSEDEDDDDAGFYPCVIDIPDFKRLREEFDPPAIATLQVSAFAHELECFPNESSFAASQREEWKDSPGLASESFIPSGLFEPDSSDSNPRRAEAIFAGHVEHTSLKTNPITGESYYYLAIHTLGGVMDVVADPQIVRGSPVVGGVAYGQFWLSGRMLSHSGHKRRGLRRLFK